MRISTAKVVLAPNQGYVCLSCRLQSAGVGSGRSRRYQHTRNNDKDFQAPPEPLHNDNNAKSTSSSTIREIVKDFMFGDTKLEGKKGDRDGADVGLSAGSPHEVGDSFAHENPMATDIPQAPSTNAESASKGAPATQQALQKKFAEVRRKQKLQMQALLDSALPGKSREKLVRTPIFESTEPLSQKALRSQRGANRAAKRKEAKLGRKKASDAKKTTQNSQKVSDDGETTSKLAESLLLPPSIETKDDNSPADFRLDEANEGIPAGDPGEVESLSNGEGHTEKSGERAKKVLSTAPGDKHRLAEAIPKRLELQNKSSGKGVPKDATKKKDLRSKLALAQDTKAENAEGKESIEPQAKGKGGEKRLSEAERKAELARKLGLKIRKHAAEENPEYARKEAKKAAVALARKSIERKKDTSSKSKKLGTKVSEVAGFDSLQSALGRKASEVKSAIEKADATKLEILPLEVPQPPVPSLSYGLERVLFNPGVYQLQDPRSRVFNFDPYLQKIMPVAEFDFNALKEYITSSRDESLNSIAKEHGKRYMGSTSSMTGVLAHFHFLLSQWRPINSSMMSKEFPTHLKSFTELQRTPQAIFLRWKDGSYAIDADKQFANANVLSMLGKSMEKLLTLNTDDYERYRKSSGGEVTDEESLAPESYHYSTLGDFLMRSQLDAHDPRLPGTGMFDLKTRAVVSIRMDVGNYEQGLGYQIRSRQGEWESYEREYYDMIRAAFLKYSMQVRMGRMDGIFVAFHNVERIFGFQYISLPEMDSTIHGQWDTSIGDQEFKLSLDLLNKILDRATKKYPETSLRIHFETREAATPFMYIFAEPVTEEQIVEIQSQNDAKIQEFERKVLGLRRGEESESEDEDGKWANIQASVQEAMDNDELSVDDPSQDQGRQAEDAESEQLGSPRSVREEGPLYTARHQIVAEEDTTPVTAVSEDDDIEEEEETETEGLTEEETEDQVENGEEEVETNDEEEENEGKGSIENEVLQDNEQPDDTKEAVEENSALLEYPADEDQMPENNFPEGSDDSAQVGNTSESQQVTGKVAQDPGNSLGPDIPQETPDTPAVTKKSSKEAEKAAYTPPVPGDEPSKSDFQTEADGSFLDSIHEKANHLEESTSESSDLLAMTLTLRNKVNDQFVLRPEKLTADDVWSIEYSLVEVPSEKRAKALYEACQMRRKKKMDAPMVPEDAEVINQYLVNLRRISTRGKQWRKEMDERDREKPVHVLGKEVVTSDTEPGRSN